MNFMIDRETISQVVIILALCIGGWLLIVEPKLSELQELDAMIAQTTANPMLLAEGTFERMVGQLDDVRDRVGEILTLNSFASDSSHMYGLIMDLADQSGITVQRLDPGTSSGQKSGDDPVQVTSFDMTVEGEYENVASFLHTVDGMTGFVRPVALQLTPKQVNGRDLVEARFACEAVSFALPEVLTAMVGGSDADG